LFASAASRFRNCSINLNVCLSNVLICSFGLLLDLDHRRLMLYHGGLDILKELSQLNHLSLDLLDRFVATLHGAKCGLGLATSVAL
jgi:hypothetical protein